MPVPPPKSRLGAPNPMAIFDRRAQRRHRARATAGDADSGFLFREGAERRRDRVADIKRDFVRALDLDSRDPLIAERLRAAGIETVVAGGPGALAVDLEALPFAPA